MRPKTLGADKGYHSADFIDALRRKNIIPHIAEVKNRKPFGLDRRTTKHASYAISQRIRKPVEEILGWFKTVGGLRKTRFKGIARTQEYTFMVGVAYNLLRMSKLTPIGAAS